MKNMKKCFLISCFCLFSIISFAQEGLGIVKHNHIALHVKDIQLAAKFYGEVLGLEKIEVPDNLKAIRAWFKIGTDQQIHLLAGREKEVTNDRNGGHYAIFVKSIAQAENYLKAKQIQHHVQVRFDGVKQIYFADPDGYLIELNELPK
jgi:catechol 2,3-dioxygenase-like lactoylglutathione lyase family enzyme